MKGTIKVSPPTPKSSERTPTSTPATTNPDLKRHSWPQKLHSDEDHENSKHGLKETLSGARHEPGAYGDSRERARSEKDTNAWLIASATRIGVLDGAEWDDGGE